jgi:hypothetical protein
MKLSILKETFAICRLAPTSPVPAWSSEGDFFSLTRTEDELSVVCRQSSVPESVRSERDWRAFKLEGPIDFSLTGVLSSLAEPLARARIGIFAISTFDTDYILVRAKDLEAAIEVLEKAGHKVQPDDLI